jgi:hypothetical protein
VNGNDVTFATGGATTTVYVTSGLGALAPGTGAKVHALWIDGAWVAKEIELNEGEDD